MAKGIYFQVDTPLGVSVRTTKEYWKKIVTTKHPSVAKYEEEIKQTLQNPDQIRKSKQDEKVNLYYKSLGGIHICVVTDNVNDKEGYIITTYLTDRIKEGEQVYVKD